MDQPKWKWKPDRVELALGRCNTDGRCTFIRLHGVGGNGQVPPPCTSSVPRRAMRKTWIPEDIPSKARFSYTISVQREWAKVKKSRKQSK